MKQKKELLWWIDTRTNQIWLGLKFIFLMNYRNGKKKPLGEMACFEIKDIKLWDGFFF